jgi:eukaryotic-like serine/threonine-protein kinase
MAAPSKAIKIGKYDVVDTIGRGGMGVVYLAKDPYLDRLVAIKMMNIDVHESGDFLKRFDHEAKQTAALDHPNIVTVYDSGEHQGRPFLVMKYLEGNSLEVLLRAHHPMSLLEKLNIIIEVCQGLGYAHQRGIVHRDIKPANIMVLNDGSVKIVDFGIARLGNNSLTRTGQIVGSLYYMPPEQIREQGVDARADIYSAGVVLYQLLTYALPFEGESTVSTLAKIISDDPPPFRQFGISCPPELEAITLKALAKNRDQRYASAEAFAGALAEVQDRLKQQAVSEYLNKAQLLQQNDELVQAQEYLAKALKLDRQHTGAAKLLGLVRARLQEQLSAERVRQLKEQAEEAYGRNDFDASLVFINQAIDLDKNPDLRTIRAEIEKAKADSELIRKAIARAEAAQRSGDLDTAKSAIEAAFSLRPNNSNIKALRRAIARDLEERDRQKKVETLLDEARKYMAERKFTSALDFLREAQNLDPSAPQLRVLLDRLASEHQQEKRRRELEQFSRDVQEALDRDDYKAASTRAAEALLKFPNESNLRRLKELADTQIDLALQKEFVRSQTATAQQLLDAGHTHKALEAVESALEKAPENARLQSFRTMLLGRMAKDRDEADKSTCLRQANEAVGIGRYADAIQLLEAARLRFTDSAELDELLHFAREQHIKVQRQASVDQSMRHAQQLLAEQHFEQAVQSLQRAVEQFPSEDLDLLLKQARGQRDTFLQDIRAAVTKGKALMDEGAIADAGEFLGSRPDSYKQSAEFLSLLTEVRAAIIASKDAGVPASGATQMFSPGKEKQASVPFAGQRTALYTIPKAEPITGVPEPIRGATPPPNPKTKLIAIGAAIVVLAIGAVVWWRSSAPKAAILTLETQPGAQVFIDEKLAGKTQSDGNLLVSGLPPGRHTIRTTLDGYREGSREITLQAGERKFFTVPIGDKFVVASPEHPKLPQPPKFGTLVVRSNVPQADVFINDQYKAQTGRDGKLEMKLEPGSYKLKLGKNGYEDSKEQRIEIAADKETRLPPLALKLAPPSLGNQPPPPNDSYLTVESTPGADVRVDGSDWGNVGSDGKISKQVMQGSYQVQLTLSGYESQSSTVTVAAGERKTLPAVLKPNPPPPPPPPPKPTAILSADSTALEEGQSTTLRWNTQYATDLKISGLGSVQPASGGQSVTPPNGTTTYVLTAKGNGESAESKVTITVRPKSQQAGEPRSEQPSSGSASSSDDEQGIRTALTNFQRAFDSIDPEKDIRTAWPSINTSVLKKLVDNIDKVQHYSLEESCSGQPKINGGTATWNCTQTEKFRVGSNIRQQPPHAFLFGFKKEQGKWVVDSREVR